MRYELKNGALAPYTKRYVRYNGRKVSNPKPENYIAAEILEKAADYDDPPEPRDGYYYTIIPERGKDDLWHKQVTYYPAPEEAVAENATVETEVVVAENATTTQGSGADEQKEGDE